ncbi:hypothetical protein B0I27_104181 [Arcticibacter pallidicorallinus]|uniref:Uncharacterized protein n=1 Tax=Arcticibacter pallidicorallinus TaxID=1259464 RepID=A0A2T0U5K0_9SPHI|nr:hypothetical protein B0I27_104181 [Arcticibacter pallidicorallinus]
MKPKQLARKKRYLFLAANITSPIATIFSGTVAIRDG